ncbi:MAG: lysylphosphatidylglycerol synthase transmembrane domain-containing protein [Anaerolineales bacterium]
MSKAAATASQSGSLLLRLLPGLLVTAVAIGALFYFVEFDSLREAFALADYRWIPLVVLVFFGTLAARTQAWRTILEERASYKDCFLILNQAYLLNNVLPFRLGELGRALLLSNQSKLNFWNVLSTVIVERVFDLGIAAALLLSTLPLVIGSEWARPAALVAAAFVLIGFTILFLMAKNPHRATQLFNKLFACLPWAQKFISGKLSSFLQGLSSLRDGPRFLRVGFWMLLAWFFNVAWYYVLMRGFFDDARWLWAFFSIAVASLGVALPSSPAYIGVLEGAMVASLSVFGVDPSISLAYAIVAHAIYLVLTGILGIIGFWRQGSSLGSVYSRLLARRQFGEVRK